MKPSGQPTVQQSTLSNSLDKTKSSTSIPHSMLEKGDLRNSPGETSKEIIPTRLAKGDLGRHKDEVALFGGPPKVKGFRHSFSYWHTWWRPPVQESLKMAPSPQRLQNRKPGEALFSKSHAEQSLNWGTSKHIPESLLSADIDGCGWCHCTKAVRRYLLNSKNLKRQCWGSQVLGYGKWGPGCLQ